MPRKYDFTPEQCKEMDLKKICNAFFVENEVEEKNRYSNTIEMIEFIKSYIITNKTLAELIKDDAVFERYNFILMKSKVTTAYDTTKNKFVIVEYSEEEYATLQTNMFKRIQKYIASIDKGSFSFLISQQDAHLSTLIFDKKNNLFIIADSTDVFELNFPLLFTQIDNFCKNNNFQLVKIQKRQLGSGCKVDSMTFTRRYLQHQKAFLKLIKTEQEKQNSQYENKQTIILNKLPPQFYKNIEENEMRKNTEEYSKTIEGGSEIIEKYREQIRNPKKRWNLSDEEYKIFKGKLPTLKPREEFGETTEEDVYKRKIIAMQKIKHSLGISKSKHKNTTPKH